MSADMQDDDEIQKGVVLFGRDISSIPCFRSSFLYGIGSGTVAGLAYFMLTSKPRMATHVAYGTFFCTTISYWFYCRYQWSKKRFGVGQLQSIMKPSTPVYDASSSGEQAR